MPRISEMIGITAKIIAIILNPIGVIKLVSHLGLTNSRRRDR